MILISQWYQTGDYLRDAELRSARDQNESSGIFKRIVFLDGSSQRHTYNELFDLAKKEFPGEPCVIANTDIVFDDTAKVLEHICEPWRLVTLTRWETECTPRMLGHYHSDLFFSGSQDSWAFVAGEMPDIAAKVPLGIVGCDQLIVGLAAQAGCEVFNPAMDVKTWHLHAEQSRPKREVCYGLYGYPELTTLCTRGLVLTHDWQRGSSVAGIFSSGVVRSTCRQ